MIIIEDTRQQAGKHEIKHRHFHNHGVSVLRSKLPFGDYAAPPRVAIDTKENMLEIAGNICGTSKEHIRFKNECIKARDCGCKLIILVENEEGIKSINDVFRWQNPRLDYSPNACTGERLAKTMLTMSDRYGIEFKFCTPIEAPHIIMEILQDDNVR